MKNRGLFALMVLFFLGSGCVKHVAVPSVKYVVVQSGYQIFSESGNLEEAIRVDRNLLKGSEISLYTRLVIHSTLGSWYFLKGDLKTAKDEASLALNMAAKPGALSEGANGGINQAHLVLSAVFYEQKNYSKAMEEVRLALKYKIKDTLNQKFYAHIYSMMGKIFLEQGKFDNAKNAFKKALKIAPQIADGYYKTAKLVAKYEEFGALNQLQGAILLDKKFLEKAYNNNLEFASIRNNNKFRELIIKPFLLQTSSSKLIIADLNFQDDNSLIFNDKILNAGEDADIVFAVKNEGQGVGFDVVLNLYSEVAEVNVSDFKKKLGDIQPGETRNITIPIKGGLDLKAGKASFLIQAMEKRGYHSSKVNLTLQTTAYIPPTLEIKSYEFSDKKIGMADGNGNGIIENGETIELMVFVENTGRGDAVGVDLFMLGANAFKLIKASEKIGRILPGGVATGKLVFQVPRGFKGNSFNLNLKVVDGRGANTKKQKYTIQTVRRTPLLAYKKRILDDGTMGTKGNGNGVVENGETIRLYITAINNGALDAKNVFLRLKTDANLVKVSGGDQNIGTITADGKGLGGSILLELNHSFSGKVLPVRISMTQLEFDAFEETLNLPVEPSFTLLDYRYVIHDGDNGTSSGNGNRVIEQGEEIELEVYVKNMGKRGASGVKVEISTSKKGIVVIKNKRSAVLGTIPSGSEVGPVALKFTVQRSADPGPLPVDLLMFQDHFRVEKAVLALNVEEEGVTVVTVAGEKQRVGRSSVTNVTLDTPPLLSISTDVRTGKTIKEYAIVSGYALHHLGNPKIEIWLNGKIIKTEGQRSISLTAVPSQKSSEPNTRKNIVEKIFLDPGLNEIKVVAMSQKGDTTEKIFTITRIKEQGEIWAVVMGVSKYKYQNIESLKYARRDAEAFTEYLMDYIGVPEDHIRALYDEEVTEQSMRSAMGTWLKENAKLQDTVYVYFAGHGAPEADSTSADGDGFEKYLLPSNAKLADLFSTALPMERISKIFRRIKSERMVFIVDSCFSGATGGRTLLASNTRAAGLTDRFWDRLSQGKGRVILSASSANEVSIEDSKYGGGHGVFTHYLLEGLKGKADYSRDGLIDIDEVYKYLSIEVPKATGQNQTPVKKGEVEGTLILGRVK